VGREGESMWGVGTRPQQQSNAGV